jgi:hypothetical protein
MAQQKHLLHWTNTGAQFLPNQELMNGNYIWIRPQKVSIDKLFYPSDISQLKADYYATTVYFQFGAAF